MARLLALDWDQGEARMVVARPKGHSITVEKTLAVPLTLSAQQGAHDELAEQLTAALSQAGIGKSQVVTAIGRSLIELGTLQLPPAPAEELPDMVRFQAMREFSSLQENSPLDFVPLEEAGRESGEVIAAAIPLDLSEQVNRALTSQGHEPHRTVMRACAVASLAMRRLPLANQGVGLIIAQQSESAELVVVKNGLVVFTRSFRLPPDWVPGETGEPMLGEVRRTIAAAQNQLGQSRVERVLLFGTPVQHAALCQRLRDRTKLEVELMDPFDLLAVDSTPTHPERFAAAIGMLLDEANDVAPVIDFLNPRKPPEPVSHTRKQVLYGGVIAAVLLGLASFVMWQYRGLNMELKAQTNRFAKVSNENKNLEPTVRLAKELREWKQADRNWLEELKHLSDIEDLTADDFMLESIFGRTVRGGRGEIAVKGKSRNLAAQQKLQVGWSDDLHQVSPKMSSPIKDKQDARYPKMFEAMIRTNQSIPIVALDANGFPIDPTGIPTASEPPQTTLPEAETEPVQNTTIDQSDQEAA